MVQSVTKALNILQLLGENSHGFELGELSERLSLNKSTAHHILKTLSSHQFVQQNNETKHYLIGHKLLEIGQGFLEEMDIFTDSWPVLQDLADKSGEVGHLVILHHDKILYLQKVESQYTNHGLRLSSHVGKRSYAHSCAAGKVLLASLDEEQVHGIVERRGLPQMTEKTITDETELMSHLRMVQEQGYAIDDEENEPGVRCVAAPVRNFGGEVISAISISGPSVRMRKAILVEKTVPLVINGAGLISRQLGYMS